MALILLRELLQVCPYILNAKQMLISNFEDANFEVPGSPYSLLSVSLSASQSLHTRRGTLVGVSGKVENVSDFRAYGSWG